MNLTLITEPTEEPVTLAEAKAHLGVDGTDDDAYIETSIASARAHVENVTRRALVTQTWEQGFRGFGSTIELARPPLQSVTSITYIDGNGDTQVLPASAYSVDTRHKPGRITQAVGSAWPSVRDEPNNVVVKFDAGYGLAADVPHPIKRALLLIIGHWFENREAVNVGSSVNEYPIAVDALLAPYRVITL